MKKKWYATAHGIELKKYFGQHFLRSQSVIDNMLSAVDLTSESSVFEIGCGDGFLTKSILEQDIKRLWVFEIDPDWANYVKNTYPDNRLTIFQENILEVDFAVFEPYKPWTLLSNLPYQITFPILYKLLDNRYLLKEGVVMVQEEVAQKIVQKSGRGYGFNSLYLQHFFDWKLLEKIPPTAFHPPPKVFSRLLYFKPKEQLDIINNEEKFWQFIKRIFSHPRRNLNNNLKSFNYNLNKVPEEILNLRAQQLSKQDLIKLWDLISAAV